MTILRTSRRWQFSFALLIHATLFANARTAGAQSLTTGTITGVVETTATAPLVDALVTLIDASTGVSRSGVADYRGMFEFRQLAPGEYTVLAEVAGYRPYRLTNIPARPGREVHVVITLTEAAPPVDSGEVVRFEGGALSGSRPGMSEWFSRVELGQLPYARRELNEVLRLSTVSDLDMSVEGLGPRLHGFSLDGVTHQPVSALRSGFQDWISAALPIDMFAGAELVTNGVDAEWSGFAGSLLSGYTRRGSRRFEAHAFGTWAGAALASSRFFEPSDLTFADAQGGVFLSGPLVQDSAHFVIGAVARRYETALAPMWPNTSAVTSLIALVNDSFDVALDRNLAPRVSQTDMITGFGRVDWQISQQHAFNVGASYGVIPVAQAGADPVLPITVTSELEARDFAGNAALHSSLSDVLNSEIRVGFSSSNLDHADQVGVTLPSALFVPDNLRFGVASDLPSSHSRNDITATGVIHYRRSSHQLKFGAAGGYASHNRVVSLAPAGVATFGGLDELARREGVSLQAVASAPLSEFSMPHYAVFLQDRWRPQPGLEVIGALRYEAEQLPVDEVIANTEWSRLTGLDNSELPDQVTTISPRLAFIWDLEQGHSWILRAAAGVYYDRAEPASIAEVIALDGRPQIWRQAGVLSNWPTPATSVDTAAADALLTLLASDYQPPRSIRGSLGFTRLIGGGAALHVSGVYRETTNLLTRRDLNRMPTPLAEDQYGRPLYGSLLQQGELLTADPGSNRRFGGFDVVSGLEPSATSEYWGVTAAVEGTLFDRIDLLASYTYSRTTDDWVGAGTDNTAGGISPALDSLLVPDWETAPSDFDVPHRFVLSAIFTGPARIRFSPLYRYQSGRPFTPGFRAGVDANADGVAFNDPAFVDEQVAGTDELIAGWDCLRTQIGSFAQRNSCRSPAVHSLDARVAIPLFRIADAPAELLIEAFNLVQSDVGRIDDALYLIDANNQLTVDATGTVHIPLVANANFGSTLIQSMPARRFRLGLQFNW